MSPRKKYPYMEEMPDFDDSWVPDSTLRIIDGSHIVAIPNNGSKAFKRLHGYGFKDETILIKNLLDIDGGSLEINDSPLTLEDHYSLQFEMEGVVDGMCAAAHHGIKYGDDSEKAI